MSAPEAAARTHSPGQRVGRALGRSVQVVVTLPERTVRGGLRALRDLDKEEEGQTLPFLAMTIFSLALVTFMVINVGQLLTAKIAAQVAADSSALSHSVWVARGMNVNSHLNIAMMLWFTEIILARAFWVTCATCVTSYLHLFSFWMVVWFYTGFSRPVIEFWPDTISLMSSWWEHMEAELWSGQYYDALETFSDIEDSVEVATVGLAFFGGVTNADTNGASYGMSGSEDLPYEAGPWHNLCHNDPRSGQTSPGKWGILDGDQPWGGWSETKHALGLSSIASLELALSAAASIAPSGNPTMAHHFAAYMPWLSYDGPLFSDLMAKHIVSFNRNGMWHFAHAQFLMQVTSWFQFFCPDPGTTPIRVMPGTTVFPPGWLAWLGFPPVDSGPVIAGDAGFGIGGLLGIGAEALEGINTALSGGFGDADRAKPRLLRSDWGTSYGYYHGVAGILPNQFDENTALPDGPYLQLSDWHRAAGLVTLAEAEVYNPQVSRSDGFDRAVGMYSPHWRARLRPIDTDHIRGSFGSIPSTGMGFLDLFDAFGAADIFQH